MNPDFAPTEEDYLTAERLTLTKNEYLAGQLFPQPEISKAQALLTVNLHNLLLAQLRGQDCTVLGRNMRLHAPAGPLYTYPDVAVVYGPVQRRPDGHEDTYLNPTLLIKVLPPVVPEHFRQVFELCYSIPSVSHLLLVTQDAPRISLSRRKENGLLDVYGFTGLDATVELPYLGLELPLADIYRHVLRPA